MLKKLIPLFVLSLVLSAAGNNLAQGKKTIILIRHAEKETSETANQNDPPLSAAGRERAERLVKRLGRYRPGAIYSTDYKRTRETVEPLARKRGKTVQTYDPAKPQELINTIGDGKIKRYLIVGHSNTIPPLANLLIGKDLFKNLQDNEHSVIWVVRMRDGKVTRVELIDY
jgi:broad specificity phosphatase PhoE